MNYGYYVGAWYIVYRFFILFCGGISILYNNGMMPEVIHYEGHIS